MLQMQLLSIPLTDAEKAQRKHELSEIEIQVLRATEDLNSAKEDFKAETKPLLKDKSRILGELRTGLVERKIEVMETVSADGDALEYWDKDMNLVHSRKLSRSEAVQLNLTKSN